MTVVEGDVDRPHGGPNVSARAARPPLTTALRDIHSPVRVFIGRRFPNLREVQRRYRDSVGPLRIGGRSDPGTAGGAFDWTVRFLTHPHPALRLALSGVARAPWAAGALREMALRLGYTIDPNGRARVGHRFGGPVPGSQVEPELLARCCWALALLTELRRVGLMPGSPLVALHGQAVSADQLLALAPAEAVTELIELRREAERVLLPALGARPGTWALGPTFAGSQLISADADLIAAGLLLEVKTNLGKKGPDGSRQASLEGQTLLQLLGYVLLDFTDEFAISEVGVYNARYGHPGHLAADGPDRGTCRSSRRRGRGTPRLQGRAGQRTQRQFRLDMARWACRRNGPGLRSIQLVVAGAYRAIPANAVVRQTEKKHARMWMVNVAEGQVAARSGGWTGARHATLPSCHHPVRQSRR